MPEILFIITIIFVAYVVYSVVGDAKKGKNNPADSAAPASVAATQQTKTASAPRTAAKKPTPAIKPAAKAMAPKKADTAASAAKEIRNPDSGEVSAVASNYRFIKRWIKDALVTEGLLEKVYKTNELDDSNAEKIKDALNKIKTLKKYKA